MNGIIIVGVEEMAIPANWHTASECRAKAESWENAEVKACVDVVLAKLWAVAEKGGIKATVPVRTGRPEHFYETFREIMTTLGYKIVDYPFCPASTTASAKDWTFSW